MGQVGRNTSLSILIIWQLVTVLFAYRNLDKNVPAFHRQPYSHEVLGRSLPRHFPSSVQLHRPTSKQLSTSIYTKKFALHPQRPMLQSIDESKFNLFQRVATWPKRKTAAMRDFFRLNLPMLRFLWPEDSPKLKLFLILSMIFMFFGKWFNLRVPFIMQRAIDTMSKNPDVSFRNVALSFIIYGLARAMSTVCAEIKTCLFVHVSQNVLRKFANQIFSHLHSLDSSFHLATPSGVISVAYVRAVRGFQTMLFQLVFSVAPTFLELAMVSQIMYKKFDPIFAIVTLITFTSYLIFTVWLTQWRVHLRQELVDVDNARNGFFIDSILNHEIVKLFNNEQKERDRFDGYLKKLQQLSIDSTIAIAWLNFGQACMFSIGLTTNLLIAYDRVRSGKMSIGDLIAVNAMLLQLAVPFNFIGYTYQELRQSFVDMGYIREIIAGKEPQIADVPNAPALDAVAPRSGPSSIEFRNVTFRYADHGDVHQLRGVSFHIEPGQSVAIVGPSGSGKSTTLKLITRMIEPLSGDILLDNVPTTNVTRASVLSRIAVVPQDCSLFDDTIEYNIRYGAVNASAEALNLAVNRANLRATIDKLPEGLQTVVGERGAKLSGGERQKVSIARAMLRDPSLILCDEVTASVDAFAEREIVETLLSATAERTTITVAHRLSSIAHSDVILVMNKGELAEQGNHETLLAKPQGLYRSMWLAQNLMDDRGFPQLAQADHDNQDLGNRHCEVGKPCLGENASTTAQQKPNNTQQSSKQSSSVIDLSHYSSSSDSSSSSKASRSSDGHVRASDDAEAHSTLTVDTEHIHEEDLIMSSTSSFSPSAVVNAQEQQQERRNGSDSDRGSATITSRGDNFVIEEIRDASFEEAQFFVDLVAGDSDYDLSTSSQGDPFIEEFFADENGF